MNITQRLLSIFLISIAVFSFLPTQAAPRSQAVEYKALLPIVFGEPAPPNPFGFDMNYYYDDRVLIFANQAKPRWVRSGDLLWSEVETQRGVYNWAALERLENNVRRVRAMGFEPTVIIQQSPGWAQRYSGRLCSPPADQYMQDFVNFTAAVAARYADGPAAIHHWEIWNEPDYAVGEVKDVQGIGCWLDPKLPSNGGVAYGNMLNRVSAAMRAANPRAIIMGGALSYEPQFEQRTLTFLRGMLSVGAIDSIDALSFHAYGEWHAGDLLIRKAERLRAVLAEYNRTDKPLFATEIAANCFSVRGGGTTCQSDFNRTQANYAARIYAEALALNLYGAFWFSLVASGSEVIANGQLINDDNGTLTPRPAFYAFRNSARLLQGASYIGSELKEPTSDQLDDVQVLTFRKGKNTLYVFWIPVTDFPHAYNLQVPAGATAICTDHLNEDVPDTYYCSDVNSDGLIPRAVNELPQYVEVVGK